MEHSHLPEKVGALLGERQEILLLYTVTMGKGRKYCSCIPLLQGKAGNTALVYRYYRERQEILLLYTVTTGKGGKYCSCIPLLQGKAGNTALVYRNDKFLDRQV